MRRAIAFLVALACGTAAQGARADETSGVYWHPDWPRFRLAEGGAVVALTVGSTLIDADLPGARTPRWTGGILFDNAVRTALVGRTLAVQEAAVAVGDYLYKGSVFLPYIVDNYIVALGIHQSVDVALQLTLMDLQSLGVAGVMSLGAEHLVGRQRPYAPHCDAHGMSISNSCGTDGDNQSFWSGHAAATATMAGLVCVHHQHLPLYGGGAPDVLVCGTFVTASLTTGVLRIVGDRHWASDVVVGWGVGALSGYVLPWVLHYRGGPKVLGWSHGRDYAAVPTPMVFPSGAGAGLVGVF